MELHRYLGDAVYATYDGGYMIMLTTGDHRETEASNIIWLEPEVVIQFFEDVAKSREMPNEFKYRLIQARRLYSHTIKPGPS